MITLCIQGGNTTTLLPINGATEIEVLTTKNSSEAADAGLMPEENGLFCVKTDSDVFLWDCFFSIDEAYRVWSGCNKSIQEASKQNRSLIVIDFGDVSGEMIRGDAAKKIYSELKRENEVC